jgi:ABC-type nitrate/sulfonate/bicarbonate transport system permease component
MSAVARKLALTGFAFALPAAIFAACWVLSAGNVSPFWPPLHDIVARFRQDWLFDLVPTELWPSVRRVVEGYALAAIGGVAVGTCLGMIKLVRDALVPILDFWRSIPAAALIPAAVLIFGVADSSKVAIIAWVSIWPILLNTMDGVRGVDPALNDLARAYRFRRRDRIFRVVLPSASPQIFAGLRISVSLALLAMVVAELFVSTSGVGFVLAKSGSDFNIATMWGAIFVLMAMSYVANAGFLLLERRILAWHRGWRASMLGEGRADSR